MWGYHDGMGWWMLFGGFWSLALLAAIVGLVVWAVSRAGAAQPTAREDPLEIAKRRLAHGEITVEQFEEIKRTIERS